VDETSKMMNDSTGNSISFVADFITQHGRAPRILHVGNIANNAYINAKILNSAGFDCDVICYGYYHIMGAPEWQDASFSAKGIDQFFPNWAEIDLGEFVRPRWFAQGPTELCIDYLLSKCRGDTDLEENLWAKLSRMNLTSREVSNFVRLEKIRVMLVGGLRFVGFYFSACAHPEAYSHLWNLLGRVGANRSLFTWMALAFSAPILVFIIGSMRGVHKLQRFYNNALALVLGDEVAKEKDYRTHSRDLVSLFAELFPDRNDKLTVLDCRPYEFIIPRWRELFSEYDLVQCYATDAMLPLLAGSTPYVAFEHGTLRAFTLDDDPFCRLTSLGYNQADHTFITNGDCLEYAKKIGVTKYSAMIHPIDSDALRDESIPASKLKQELGVDYLFFCPLRHDWVIKGTDKYIRALAAIEKVLDGSFVLVMTEWGEQIDASKGLAEDLGVAHLIHWITPIPKRTLAQILKVADAVFDQLALPHFGATAPEAIAAGVPVLMSYEPASTEWIIEQTAPILASHCVEDIVENVQRSVSSSYLDQYQKQAKHWFDENHSPETVLSKHVEVYSRLLKEQS
jgi:glycosyltransferase involved in cell wall biosynthesis